MSTSTNMEIVIHRDDLRHMFYVFPILTEQEHAVLMYRFGLYGEEPHSLSEIAKAMEYPRSPERIRQIQTTAIKKLKNAFFATQGSQTLEEYKRELEQKAQEAYEKLHPRAKLKPKPKQQAYQCPKKKRRDQTLREACKLIRDWIQTHD